MKDKAKKARIIDSLTAKAKLKRKVRKHLKEIGFVKLDDGSLSIESGGKEIIRALHSAQRVARIDLNKQFIASNTPKLLKYFASGTDINPNNINPTLQRVYSDTWESNLFRIASLTWSVPVSNGFGRRLRYLVWDTFNGKLIGLLAIGDPVFNLTVRDQYIGWNLKQRGDRLVNLLDAYVLGAVPPYNSLLCGKLIACLLRSKELYYDFGKEYGKSTGIISGVRKSAKLLAITTSSSMGRSSVYNRLKLGGVEYLKPLGFTKGWGHFHIPEGIFAEMRDYLRSIKHPYADLHKFGEGPNWRLRTARAALDALGFREDLLKHGVGRQVFICSLASNAVNILSSGKGKPETSSLLTVSEISTLAKDRWIVPRANSRLEFKYWQNQNIKNLIITGNNNAINNGIGISNLNVIR